MQLKAKVLVASSGLLLSLAAASGIASAQPNLDIIINSTCTYPQVMAALNASDPAVAQEFSASPTATGWLQALVNAGPAERTKMVQQAQRIPALRQYEGLIMQVANTCNNF